MRVALIGYRNELQHAEHKSVSTINLRITDRDEKVALNRVDLHIGN